MLWRWPQQDCGEMWGLYAHKNNEGHPPLAFFIMVIIKRSEITAASFVPSNKLSSLKKCCSFNNSGGVTLLVTLLRLLCHFVKLGNE